MPSCLRASPPLPFQLFRLRDGLKPFRLHWFTRVRSTNDHAAMMRRRNELFAPAVVLAGRQTAGRGRGSHVWWSAPGCLTVTFAIPIDEQIAPHQVPLIAGLAVRDAAATLSENDAIQLKWPNDLLYQNQKLGGLLCQRISRADLIGLGLNINVDRSEAPVSLRSKMTTLADICRHPVDPTDALVCIAAHLRASLARAANRPFGEVLRDYDAHHALLGQRVTVVDGPDAVAISGRCQGLDSTGRLLLRNGKTLHHVISGQVLT